MIGIFKSDRNIKKYRQINPKFANVKGQLLHTVDKWKAEKSILLSHLKIIRNLLKIYLFAMMNYWRN